MGCIFEFGGARVRVEVVINLTFGTKLSLITTEQCDNGNESGKAQRNRKPKLPNTHERITEKGEKKSGSLEYITAWHAISRGNVDTQSNVNVRRYTTVIV